MNSGFQTAAADSDEKGYILVVDDDDASREMLARRLQRVGFQVESAAGGQEALERVANAPFDLVLLDRSMPQMGGMEVLRVLREKRTARDLPVIMVTAEAQSESVSEALEAGANDYITKPLDFRVALSRIRNHLGHRRAERRLQHSERRYALAVEGANDVVIDWNVASGELYASPRWNEILGLTPGETPQVIGDWFSRVHPSDLMRLHEAIQAHSRGAQPNLELDHRLRHADGTYRWVRSRCKAVYSSDGLPERISGALTDITASKTADPLTGLPNRTYLSEALAYRMEASRAAGTPLAVLFLDLDGFKYVNDSLGHTAGDELLIQVAERLRRTLSSCGPLSCGPAEVADSVLMARLGGDEFAVLVSGYGDGRQQAELIRHALSAPFRVSTHQVYVTTSIGIAVYNRGYTAPHELLRDADTAMYRAKVLGKNRLAVFTGAMRAQVTERLRLGNSIRDALARGDFQVAFQPIVTLADRSLVGLEALLRWPAGAGKPYATDQVIRVAEETGVIFELGQWVLEESCRQMLRFHAAIPGRRLPYLHVNVSGVQFATGNFDEKVMEALQLTGLDPSWLGLEITETAVMKDVEGVLVSLKKLQANSVRLSIDDFGTGYSSLSYLNQFPFDTLKLDRSFLHHLDHSHGNTEIVRAVIQLAHALHMKVVAEGIETAEEACWLQQFGCEYGQGYHFSHPMFETEVMEYLTQHVAV